jgi:predicted  nucleic acid-binding Zn-ribbon protein
VEVADPAAESLADRVDRLESELAEVRERLAALERSLGVV